MGEKKKMIPVEKSWFELYVELKSRLTSRIFALEERVKALENAKSPQSPGNIWVGRSK